MNVVYYYSDKLIFIFLKTSFVKWFNFQIFFLQGHFLYTESLRHLRQGDYADVISKTYSTQKGRQQCLSFSYSVYGKDESILKVYVKDMTTTYLSQPFAMHASLQGDWRRAIVQIYPENNFQVIIYQRYPEKRTP